ncbi:MAG: hypothetical protein H8D43_03115 [Chloroflexi bacterium]|nr:hypothetical protein [Chloroflexota bacterium]
MLDISHIMTRSGYGWTGTFFSDHRTRFLAIIAHSRVIGSRPGGERNPTEIAVVLFRGGEGVEGVEWLWDGSEDWEELEKQLIEDKHLQSTP